VNAFISKASLSDAGAIVALRTAVALGMAQEFGAGPWSACPDLAEVEQQLRVSQVLVARREAGIIGTVRLATMAQSAFYVLGLAVAPDCRGMGVGRRLMKAAKDAARSRPEMALWLDAYDHAAGAGPFYIKCGFRERGRTTHDGMALILYEWLETGEGSRPIR
jgi:ribosomal protein S18 acetylase RimI-like enzyme